MFPNYLVEYTDSIDNMKHSREVTSSETWAIKNGVTDFLQEELDTYNKKGKVVYKLKQRCKGLTVDGRIIKVTFDNANIRLDDTLRKLIKNEFRHGYAIYDAYTEKLEDYNGNPKKYFDIHDVRNNNRLYSLTIDYIKQYLIETGENDEDREDIYSIKNNSSDDREDSVNDNKIYENYLYRLHEMNK